MTTVTDLSQVRFSRGKLQAARADELDNAIAVGLLCSSAQLHLAAQTLLDTGRVELARILAEAADLTHAVYKAIRPSGASIGTTID